MYYTRNISVRQLFDEKSHTYTYVAWHLNTKRAVIIDPVIDQIDRDIRLIKELGLDLIFVLDTHMHADHITGAAKLLNNFGAALYGISAAAGVDCAQLQLKDKQVVQIAPGLALEAIATPGHTDGCMSFYIKGEDGLPCVVFTGDALLIHKCGRTDFQQGSSEKLFHSVMERLYKLPDNTLVLTGHNYDGLTCSTIGEEKKYNLRLYEGQTLEGFKEIMDHLNLAPPKQIEQALKHNLLGGN